MIKDHIKAILQDASRKLKYPKIALNLEQNINEFTEQISDFLKSLPEDYKQKFESLIIEITDFDLLNRFVQFVANYNYQQDFSDTHEGIKFILLCAAIESFNNFDKGYRRGSTQRFVKFLSKQTDKNKELIKKTFIVKGEKLSDKDLIEYFSRYIYFKRSQFIHEGIRFRFKDDNKDNCFESFGYGDLFPDKDVHITLNLTFKEFILLVIDALYNNIEELIEEQ